MKPVLGPRLTFFKTILNQNYNNLSIYRIIEIQKRGIDIEVRLDDPS